MSEIVNIILQVGLVVMILLLVPCFYRGLVGPSLPDRLQAFDVITMLSIGILLLLDLIQGTRYLIDIAMALAALAFITTLALSRYLSEGRMF